MFNTWKDQEFPRNEDSVSYNRYKLARKNFRNLVKHSKNQATVNHYINVDKIKHIKPKSFWKNIKMLKSTTSKLYTINEKLNNEDITEEFTDHFNMLLNTPRISNANNQKSNKMLQDYLQSLENAELEEFYITEENVCKAIKYLKKGKTKDPFELTAEHFFHAISEPFIKCIKELMNNIFTSGDLPKDMSTSLIIPLIKSHKKPLSSGNNYRGISLIPIMTKLLETIILQKCLLIKEHDKAQFGFASQSSTLHAEYLIQETISYYNDKNTPVYICSLDAEKAFDCCNWLQLFDKLRNKQLPTSVIRILIKLYLKGQATVRYKNLTSYSFALTQGVRQGSILSPYFYNIYTQNLLHNIRSMKLGTLLPDGTDTSIIAFADDLILLSPNLHNLQSMINQCVSYGKKHLINFNHCKTQFLISGLSRLSHPFIYLQGQRVQPITELTHLGFQWSKNKNNNKLSLQSHKDKRISELWSVTAALISAGIRKCHPNSLNTIFQTIVIPKLLYGIELINLSKTDLLHIDVQVRSCLKRLFGVSTKSRNLLHKTFRINEATTLLTQRKFNLFLQLLNNTATSNYTFWCLQNQNNFSFVNEIKDLCENLGIDLITMIIDRKIYITQTFDFDNDTDILIRQCKTYIENWNTPNSSKKLKEILEHYVYM